MGSRLIQNPKDGWTKFDYHILFKENNQNFLVIFQDDKPIVRVDGPFAYDRTESGSQLNFKIGIYQDIQRGGITLDVDDVDVNEYSADSDEFRQFLAETSR